MKAIQTTKMNKGMLTPRERDMRMNVRNFLLVATPEELRQELEISRERGDHFRAACVEELMIEEGLAA